MDTERSVVPLSDEWLSVQSETFLPQEVVDSQLLVLQTAFPSVVRNYDEYEYQALRNLWYEIFKRVPQDLMEEAIKRFIINDRKGFFPSPGQIVGYIEQIVMERKFEKLLSRTYERYRRGG